MSIQNEVVKFIAEIELDAQDQANFLQGLKECDKECSDLRDEILNLQNSLTKLRAEGKENTKEFNDLQEALSHKTQTLKETTKQADKYSSALGASRMSMNQLKKYAKELQSAMNNMHKESDPEQWAKYEKELKVVNDRIKELKTGSDGAKKGMSSMLENIANGFTIANIGLKAFSVLWDGIKNGFKNFMEQTQVWGDKWQMTVAMVKAGWNQFIANLGQGKDVIKASVNDAIKAAADAQLLIDELFERENSTAILTVKIKTEINELMGIVKDVSKSDEERFAALEKVFEKEAEIAKMKRDVAQQDLDAKTLLLSTRTGLEGRSLEIMVDEYEKYRDLINISAEYNTALDNLDATEEQYYQSIGTSSEKYWAHKVQQQKQGLNAIKINFEQTKARLEEEQKIVIDGSIDTWKGWYNQYNLSNDELVKGYVDAKVAVLQVDNELEQHNAKLAARRGSLTKEMNAEDEKARQNAYSKAKDDIEGNHRSELNSLKEQLLSRTISQEEYNTKSAELELERLEKLKELNLKYGKDISAIDGQILDHRIKNQSAETKEPPHDLPSVSGELTSKLPSKVKTTSNTKLALPSDNITFETEMTGLNILHEAKAISEEEFLLRRNELYEKYNIEQLETEQTLWEQGTNGKLQATKTMLDAMGQAVSTAKDAELAYIDAQMQAELSAAGENAKEREQIEAKYEAKKLNIQKKYADVELGISIAQAIAQGALAVIQAWAQLGPIAGSVYAAIVGATTAAQIAVMVQQRDAIKNSSPGGATGSSNGGTTTVRTANGFSDGGYTGDGGRLEVAGIVHRGEYVVPQPEMRDPAVAAMVANIEVRRLRRTSANALPGFAEGGYTGFVSGSRHTDDLLSQILKAIRTNNENPVPAYVVFSELNRKQELANKYKSLTSLHRK